MGNPSSTFWLGADLDDIENNLYDPRAKMVIRTPE